MDEVISLRCREIGWIKHSSFCPRCFWLQRKFPLQNGHPYYSPMPGMLSTLDAYIKRVVLHTFNLEKNLPEWLSEVTGDSKIYKVFAKLPSWEVKVEEKFLLKGSPDAVWQLDDGSLFIADYKVAKWSDHQESLLPLYEYQAKAYAYLAEKNGYRVSRLALIYFEPKSEFSPEDFVKINRESLALHFVQSFKPVDKASAEEIEFIVKELGQLLLLPYPPEGKENCPGCKSFEEWMRGIVKMFVIKNLN